MNDEYHGSVQKELIAERKSFSAKYASLFLGEKNLFKLIRFELTILFFSRTPGALGFFLRRLFYPGLFKSVGRGVVFGKDLTIRHPSKISIGDNTFIDDYVVLDAKGRNNTGIRIGRNVLIGRGSILSCKEGSIYLDDFVNISANCMLLSETEIRMGKYSFLAGRCYLVAGGNHTFEDITIPIMFQPSYSKGGIKIGEDVWLAAGVIVVDGVSIGRGTIVSAGSVVGTRLPANIVAMGIPATKLKDRAWKPKDRN